MLLILALLALAPYVAPADATQQRTCPLLYTDDLKKDVVIPELRRLFASDFVYFEYDRPYLSQDGNALLVWLNATREVNGKILMFEDAIVIEIDCDKRLVKTTRKTYGPFDKP